jgi:hypothetical protein
MWPSEAGTGIIVGEFIIRPYEILQFIVMPGDERVNEGLFMRGFSCGAQLRLKLKRSAFGARAAPAGRDVIVVRDPIDTDLVLAEVWPPPRQAARMKMTIESTTKIVEVNGGLPHLGRPHGPRHRAPLLHHARRGRERAGPLAVRARASGEARAPSIEVDRAYDMRMIPFYTTMVMRRKGLGDGV